MNYGGEIVKRPGLARFHSVPCAIFTNKSVLLRFPWVRRLSRYSRVHNHNSPGVPRLSHNSIYTYIPSNYSRIDANQFIRSKKIYCPDIKPLIPGEVLYKCIHANKKHRKREK